MIDDNPILLFWTAPNEALFPQGVISRVRHVSDALLERERWQNSGPKYLKLGGRVLYRKSDVLKWIEQHGAANCVEQLIAADPPRAAIDRAADDAERAIPPTKALPPKRRGRSRAIPPRLAGANAPTTPPKRPRGPPGATA
jgi:hypothetical protein